MPPSSGGPPPRRSVFPDPETGWDRAARRATDPIGKSLTSDAGLPAWRWEASARIPEAASLPRQTKGEKKMLWTIAVILLVLWALGLVTSYTVGGYIHILLVVAVIVAVIRLIQGRRVL